MPTDPATVPPLTDAETAKLIREALEITEGDASDAKVICVMGSSARLASAAYALAASRVDTAELMPRLAKKDGLNARAEYEPDARGTFHVQAWYDTREAAHAAYIAITNGRREYPAPAPRECVLSDGSVVRCDDDRVEFTRYRPGHLPRVSKPEHWPLLVDDLTGADFEKLQAFAAEVGQ